jgi:ribonuclease HI
VTVYSDSNYVVNAIGNWCDGQPFPPKIGWIVQWQSRNWARPSSPREPNKELKNKDLWQEMYNLLIKQSSVTMRWIRGHSGNKFNELCDAVAMKEVTKAIAES